MRKTWMETNLWRYLEDREPDGQGFSSYLRVFMDGVETLLSSSSTSPLDFTLHDEQHSFRVAQRISELLEKDKISKLSAGEIALLLCSSYLHDIGMSPKRAIVRDITEYLFDPKASTLADGERDRLQGWLDDYEPGAQAPILEGQPFNVRNTKINELTTYYCRHRHNDWSADYISEVQPKGVAAPYPTWNHDLILLCKSHHYGRERLEKEEFNLRWVGPEKGVINLRYLAALLRVADVLDIDPERTPQVLLDHRAVDKKSLVFWYKDQEMVVIADSVKHDIIVTARTRDAWVHKGVLETVEGIDAELAMCGEMQRAGYFTRGMQSDDLSYYSWKWSSKVSRDIRPISDTFEFINGAFRPDTQRLLGLLAGTRLYGSSFAALRELVQNAADAVREQIANETVLAASAFSPVDPETRARLHAIQVELFRDDKTLCLRCSDSGTGMSKEVIENHLLVSGSKPRPALLGLQRRCSVSGVEFQRSGEFGIGVLSYFMIAKRVVIITKASEETSSDRQAWKFELDGVGSFGELRPIAKPTRGTEITLYLKDEFSELDQEEKIFKAIIDLIAKAPCNLTIKNGSAVFATGPGWVRKPEQVMGEIYPALHSMKSSRGDKLISQKRKSEEDRKRDINRKIIEKSQSTLKLDAEYTCQIVANAPNSGTQKIGEIRIFVPYFQLADGVSLHFVDHENGAVVPDAENRLIQERPWLSSTSWRGFRLEPRWGPVRYRRGRQTEVLCNEIDLNAQGKISVDRTSVDMEDENVVDAAMASATMEAENRFFEKHPSSIYSVLDKTWTAWRRSNGLKPIYKWFLKDPEKDSTTLRDIRFPAVYDLFSNTANHSVPDVARSGFGIEDVLRTHGNTSEAYSPLLQVQPEKLLITRNGLVVPFLLYREGAPFVSVKRTSVSMSPKWSNMLCLSYGNRYFNVDHPIYKSVSDADFDVYVSESKHKDLAHLIKEAADSDVKACCFVQRFISEDVEYWMSVQDNFKKEWLAVHSRLGIGDRPIICWQNGGTLNCLSVEKERANFYRVGVRSYDKKWSHLPNPGELWMI